MTNHLVLVAGYIALGKTSLTERLGGRLGWQPAFESTG
jgi:deoxyadenosine/deoxycytidine kinase